MASTATQHTYTFALRSAHDPVKALTLTLVNDTLHFELTGAEDMMEKVATAKDRVKEATEQLMSRWEVVSLKAAERLAGRIHLHDVTATYRDRAFQLWFWERLGGLRLFPAWINVDQVDNPEAAAAFAAEVERRKRTSSFTQSLPGPLDYWITWVGLGIGLVAALRRVRD
jgi:hypothetical protein